MNSLVKPVASVNWNDIADHVAGQLLRLRHEPIIRCANGHQRRGWWTEHARQRHTCYPKRQRDRDTGFALRMDGKPFESCRNAQEQRGWRCADRWCSDPTVEF
jgi:hypothetical protein